LPGRITPSRCAFVERDGKLVGAGTGDAARIDSPCMGGDGSIGHSPGALQQATLDVEKFLRTVFWK
jgi:hypothetical protein